MTSLLMETARGLTTRLGEELRPRPGEKLRRRVVRTLVSGADTLAGITLSIWKQVRETLEGEGFEGRELAGHCQVVLDGIDGSLAAYERLLGMAEAAGLTPEAASLHDLETKLPALRATRPKVAEALALATRPPRPVDEKALAESEAALARGDFVTLDDAHLARLRAGADI